MRACRSPQDWHRLEAELETHSNPALHAQNVAQHRAAGRYAARSAAAKAEMLSKAHLFAEATRILQSASRLAPHAPTFSSTSHWRAIIAGNGTRLSRPQSGQRRWRTAARPRVCSATFRKNAANPLPPSTAIRLRSRSSRMSNSIAWRSATELLMHQTFDAAIVVLEQAAGLFPKSAHTRSCWGWLTSWLIAHRIRSAIARSDKARSQ